MKISGWLALAIFSMNIGLALSASDLGVFFRQADIGRVLKPGSVDFNAAKGEYLIAGGGENMWFTNDTLHFVWKKMSGDFTLTADVKFIGTGGNPHRKACLLVRQSLDADSVSLSLNGKAVGPEAIALPLYSTTSGLMFPVELESGENVLEVTARNEGLKPLTTVALLVTDEEEGQRFYFSLKANQAGVLRFLRR